MTIYQLHDGSIPIPEVREKKLWAAVLVQAFVDLEGITFGYAIRADMAMEQAERWIKSNDRSYIGSFLYVCEVLDFNPEYVRNKFRQARCKVKRKEKIRHNVTARIKNFDPAKLENMTCLEIARYFNTTKSVVYNVVSKMGIKYKQIRPRSGNHRKKNILTTNSYDDKYII